MTAYLVRVGAQKKKGILEKREAELIHCIADNAGDEKLSKVAAKVKAAQKSVIKCLLHESEPVRTEDERQVSEKLRNLKQDEEHWDKASIAEIIEIYRNRIDGDND